MSFENMAAHSLCSWALWHYSWLQSCSEKGKDAAVVTWGTRVVEIREKEEFRLRAVLQGGISGRVLKLS